VIIDAASKVLILILNTRITRMGDKNEAVEPLGSVASVPGKA
jgi:hypothetical protein